MKFAFIGIKGLEDVHLIELSGFKVKKIEQFEGIIFFDSDDVEGFENLKTVDDVLIFAKKLENISRYRKSLGNLRQYLREYYIGYEAKTFSVKASYIGRRDYTAKEVEEIATEEISEKYNWKKVPEFGDVHVNIILHPDVSLIGISVGDKPLYVKNKLETVPGSLRSSLADSLLKIADVKEGDVFLDPMCGSGILPIKASGLGATAYGIDIEEKYIEIAKKNASSEKIIMEKGDALKTGFKDDFFDKIVCNLPFGKQVQKEFDIDKFLEEMKRISKKDALLVLLTKDDMSGKGFEKREITNSGMDLFILTKRLKAGEN